jgi:glycosyltransferase involved in cell wall biosynthesis
MAKPELRSNSQCDGTAGHRTGAAPPASSIPGIRDLVIIPALNEAATLPAVLDQLRREVPWADVVVVDDGSSDATVTVAKAGGAIALRLPFNLGIGGALRTGFRYAVDHDYQRAVQVDADGQHDPGAVEKLFAALDDADLVIGSRFGGAGDYDVGRTRRGAMRLLQFTLRLLSGRTFTDTSSGFRAFSRPLLEYFSKSYPSEYMESVEALIGAYYAGFRIVEVPTEMHQRAGGAPSNLRIKLVYHYVRVIVTILIHAGRRPQNGSSE